jgi:hypothetical protein
MGKSKNMIRNQQVSGSIPLIGSKLKQGVTDEKPQPLVLWIFVLSPRSPHFSFLFPQIL